MEETTVSIIGVLIASIIMFIVPIVLISDISDDISELVVQTATAEFVNDVIKTGEITSDRYQRFILSLQSSGNTYEIDMEVKILDENTSKYVTDGDPKEIGSNTYYSIYTSQIEEKIGASSGRLVLKQGDGISVTVRNSSATFSQALKSVYYSTKGNDIHIIAASASGTVAINGTS